MLLETNYRTVLERVKYLVYNFSPQISALIECIRVYDKFSEWEIDLDTLKVRKEKFLINEKTDLVTYKSNSKVAVSISVNSNWKEGIIFIEYAIRRCYLNEYKAILVHAGAVVNPNSERAHIYLGSGGTGKTAKVICHAFGNDLKIAGDDRVWLTADFQLMPFPRYLIVKGKDFRKLPSGIFRLTEKVRLLISFFVYQIDNRVAIKISNRLLSLPLKVFYNETILGQLLYSGRLTKRFYISNASLPFDVKPSAGDLYNQFVNDANDEWDESLLKLLQRLSFPDHSEFSLRNFSLFLKNQNFVLKSALRKSSDE